MKFTREDALKVPITIHNRWDVAEQVFDACQKAFEEERADLQKKLKETTEYAISEASKLRCELASMERENAQGRNELRIANGIVASRNQEVAKLRKELDERCERIRLLEEGTPVLEAAERSLKPSFPPPCAPDPGEGYRLLDPEKDNPMSGDEASGKWRPLAEERWRPIESMRFNPSCWYRRKIEPAPVEAAEPAEPDPLEALLASIKNESLYELSTLHRISVILIERELARTRKEQK